MTENGEWRRLVDWYSLEIKVFEREVDFDDAGGLDARPEDILLRGLIVLGSQSV